MTTAVAHGQTAGSKARIFISYSRKDIAFADRLEAALKARGFEPLMDRTDIYAFEDWWKRIEALISQADTVVFVLSPDAVASRVTLKEVAHAASLNKRFAPIVYRHVDGSAVPEPLRRLNSIFFDHPARFEDSAGRLAEALRTDIGWIRQHTEYGEAARHWSAADRPRGLLLRSPALEEAERWIASRPADAPAPTGEIQTFVAESRRGATRRRNILTGSLAAGLLIALALAMLAEGMREKAEASFATADSLLTDFVQVVSDNVAPTAPLTTVESLMRHVQQAIEKLPTNHNAQLTMQRARMFIILAELNLGQGDISSMHANSVQAHDLMASLNPTADNNPEALHLLARSNTLTAMFWQARVQPNFDRAMDSYKDALGQLQQLQERFDKSGSIADGWRWSRSLALLQRDIGDFLLSKRSKIKEADESFQQSSETFRKLKQLRPVDVEIDFNLAWAANKSGDMLYQQGQFDAALDQFEIARDGITALGERYLWANLEWRGLLSVVYGNVGLSLREQMKFQKAIEAFDECAKQVGKLVELDPQRAFWREVLAWAHDVMGETKIQWAQTEHDQTLLEGARQELDTAKAMRDKLAQEALAHTVKATSARDAAAPARLTAEGQITAANIADLDGTIKQFAKDFGGAARDFQRAAKVNPTLDDERQEEMIFRRTTFLKLAGLNYLEAGRHADGRKLLEQALDIANKQIADAVYPERFSKICTELRSRLDKNLP